MGSITGMSWTTEDGHVIAHVMHSDHNTGKYTYSHDVGEDGEVVTTEEEVPKKWPVSFPESEIADMDHDEKVAHITKRAVEAYPELAE